MARRYWRLLSQDRFDAAYLLLAPGSPIAEGWPGADAIVEARLISAQDPVLAGTLKDDVTVQFPVQVYIHPEAAAGSIDEPGVYTMFMSFVRMSDESWRLTEVGTGP